MRIGLLPAWTIVIASSLSLAWNPTGYHLFGWIMYDSSKMAAAALTLICFGSVVVIMRICHCWRHHALNFRLGMIAVAVMVCSLLALFLEADIIEPSRWLFWFVATGFISTVGAIACSFVPNAHHQQGII